MGSEEKVEAWRQEQFERMGVSIEQAVVCAKDRSLDLRLFGAAFRKLLDAGCSPELAVAILT